MSPFLYQRYDYFLMSDVMVYVSDLSWGNFRRHHAKDLWFKWRPNVCIWIAILQWQSFYFLITNSLGWISLPPSS